MNKLLHQLLADLEQQLVSLGETELSELAQTILTDVMAKLDKVKTQAQVAAPIEK
jgi:hypothetical protein